MEIKGVKFLVKLVEKLKEQAQAVSEACDEKEAQIEESERMPEERVEEWNEYLENVRFLTSQIEDLNTDDLEA